MLASKLLSGINFLNVSVRENKRKAIWINFVLKLLRLVAFGKEIWNSLHPTWGRN